MKTRIVMWGTNAREEKVLIAIALRAEENAVDIYTFPFEIAPEEFYNLMINEWRESHEVTFPEGFTHVRRALTSADTLLPEDLKVERTDVILRAQTEWHFIVLSNKLYQSFHDELNEIKEKIKTSDNYKNQLWEEMKGLWEKIQKNIFDRSLLREHGHELREMTNDIFTSLKNMRKDLDSEFDRVSKEFADAFNAKLDEVEAKMKSGLGLQPLFNDLKRIQAEFKDAQLSKSDRAKIWKRIDAVFKTVKEKKFGEKSNRDSSAMDRLKRRYDGLISAIDKMEKSIRHDHKDKQFEDSRIAASDGQLESQIRMAKLKMIEERINSKQMKLDEMLKTKAELDERMNRERKYQEEQKKQQVLKDELKEARESVKQKIADDIHERADQVDADALNKAAEAIAAQKAGKGKPKKKESLLDAITETLGESLEDVGDSLGAIASVVGDKLGEAFDDIKEEIKERMDKEEKEEKPNEESNTQPTAEVPEENKEADQKDEQA